MDGEVEKPHPKQTESYYYEPKKLNWLQTVWPGVTLEPMWLGVGITFMINMTTFSNFYLQRACRVDLNYTEEICLHSEGEKRVAMEFESQKVISSIIVLSSFISNVITFTVVLFLAPWSDACGRRKPLIIWSLLGTLCSNLGLLLVLALPQLPAIWPVYLHSIPSAIGGTMLVLALAGFDYLGDICYKTGRCTLTVIGTNMAFFTIASTIGSILGPLVYRWFNFIGVFSLCIGLEMFSLIYAIMTVEDVNVVGKISSMFNLNLPWKAVQCFFQKREGYRRRNIFLMTIAHCSCNTMAAIEFSLAYMYLRNKLLWTEIEYGGLMTLKNILSALGAFFIVEVLKKKINMKESHIGILGGVAHVFSAIALMISTSSLMIYCTSIVVMLSRAVMIAEIPVINKQIIAHEQGKIGCVKTLLGLLCFLTLVPLCSRLYRVTLDWFPGAFLLVNIVLSLIQILCYSLVRENDTVVDSAEEKMRPSENHI